MGEEKLFRGPGCGHWTLFLRGKVKMVAENKGVVRKLLWVW